MKGETRRALASGGVYQLRITLRDVAPPVWRRVLVRGTTTLSRLHRVIQEAFGWQDYHLWEFTVGGDRYEAPDAEAEGKDASKVKLKDLVLEIGDSFKYVYDPGDAWQHDVVLEDCLAPEPEAFYPVCRGGARASPPEDCGGAHRYGEALRILEQPAHPEYAELREWLAEDFDPEAFDLRATNRVLQLAFGGSAA